MTGRRPPVNGKNVVAAKTTVIAAKRTFRGVGERR
jgi:hypothetical protein